jgi:hypothetical protein
MKTTGDVGHANLLRGYIDDYANAPGRDRPRKKAAHRGAAKFREETSKKADSAAKGRIAAVRKIGRPSFVCK